MADDGRQPQPGLIERPSRRRRWISSSCCAGSRRGGRRFGRGGRPDAEPARLGQAVRLGFAVRDVAALAPAAGERAGAGHASALIGLLGPEGPLPLHLTRWVLDRLSQRWFAAGVEGATSDTTFLDFANLLSTGCWRFYYRAWADQRPEVQAERAARRADRRDAARRWPGRRRRRDRAGQARPGGGARPPGARPGAADRPARRRARRAGDDRGVRREPGRPIPPRLQSRLGGAHAALGARRGARAARLRAADADRAARRAAARCRLSRASCRADARLATLRRALLHAVGETLDVDVRPVLRRDAVPAAAARRGAAGPHRLARAAARPGRATTCGCAPWSASPPRAEGGGMSLLLTLEHAPRPQPVRQMRLDEGELVIGRGADADWRIDDPDSFVSRAPLHGDRPGRRLHRHRHLERRALRRRRSRGRSAPATRRRCETACGCGSATMWCASSSRATARVGACRAPAAGAGRRRRVRRRRLLLRAAPEPEPRRPRPADLPDPFEAPVRAGRAREPPPARAAAAALRRPLHPRPGAVRATPRRRASVGGFDWDAPPPSRDDEPRTADAGRWRRRPGRGGRPESQPPRLRAACGAPVPAGGDARRGARGVPARHRARSPRTLRAAIRSRGWRRSGASTG